MIARTSERTTPKGSLGIQRRLIILLIAVLLPILGSQAFVYYDRLETRKSEELKANMEMARAMGVAFEAFVQQILHQELAIGLAATTASLSPTDLTRLLGRSQQDFPAVSYYNWVSPEGRVLASSRPEGVGIDGSDRGYFKEIVAGRDWAVSDVVLGKVTGEPIFTVSRGIRDENGVLLGIVMATIVPEMLDSVLHLGRSGDAGVSLIDSKGMHVYRYPSTEFTWEQRNWLKHYPSIEEALKGKDIGTTIVSELTGKERLVGFTPIASMGWVSSASRAKDEAMKPVTSSLIYHGSIFLVVALASFLFALWMSRGIAKPMEKIHKHVLSLGRGGWDSHLEVLGPLEMQALANALNGMAMERKEAEEELRISEEKFRFAATNIPDTLFFQDRDLRYVWIFNPAEPFQESQVVGRTDADLLPSEEAGRLAAIKRKVLETGAGVRMELQLSPGGITRWYEALYEPSRDGEGRIVGVVSYSRDVTERKEAEEAIRKARDELETRVQERTVELKEMNKELQRSNQALQDFASIAAHDLQEPLRKVQMFGDLVRIRCEGELGLEGKEYISRMNSAAVRMHSLLNALLEYARVTSRAKPFAEVRLNRIVQDVLTDLEARIQETGGTVEVESLPTVLADPTQMSQLFQNLIGNALKFHKGDEKPLVKVSSQRSNELQYRITVADNGIGFDEKYLQTVFSPFQRLHGKSSDYEGTGMGLAICKKIVERHGGTLTAKSTPGKGSAFIVDLPIQRNDREENREQLQSTGTDQ
jgi:PAS domain S-box-containing protein